MLVIGSLFVFSLLFALMPDASAAGVIEGEFKLGEVLDESIGWFIVVRSEEHTSELQSQ